MPSQLAPENGWSDWLEYFLVSFWGPAYFQGRTVSFRGRIPQIRELSPIEKGGYLASCVSFTKGTVSIHTKCFQLRMKLPLVGRYIYFFE